MTFMRNMNSKVRNQHDQSEAFCLSLPRTTWVPEQEGVGWDIKPQWVLPKT